MDPGDSMSSGQVHDASTSVMADAVNATDAASSEYRVMYFVMLSVHFLTVVFRHQIAFPTRGSVPYIQQKFHCTVAGSLLSVNQMAHCVSSRMFSIMLSNCASGSPYYS
jgi:hypothetical protein